jgi:hypothetical protein
MFEKPPVSKLPDVAASDFPNGESELLKTSTRSANMPLES